MDGALHPDEHGIQEKGKQRLKKELCLQADEQLGFRKDDGKPEESRRHKNCKKHRQNEKTYRQPFVLKTCIVFKRPGRS